MRKIILRAILAISACLMPAAMATAQAEVFYLRGPCRIYIDTDFIRLPNHAGRRCPSICARHLGRI